MRLKSTLPVLSTTPRALRGTTRAGHQHHSVLDVDPTDWAYQALSNLIERYGCVAGYPNGTYRGNRVTRFEAARAGRMLDRVTEVTDELKRLMIEFEKELPSSRAAWTVWKPAWANWKQPSSPPPPS